jgi:hypothetical protein
LEIDDDYVIELVSQYLIDNDLPDEIILWYLYRYEFFKWR